MRKILLLSLLMLSVLPLVAQMESDEARALVNGVSKALGMSEEDASSMLLSADEVVASTQDNFTAIAAFQEESKKELIEEAIYDFRDESSTVQTSNKNCAKRTRAVRAYLNNLENVSGRLKSGKIKNVTLEWGEDAIVERARVLIPNKKYKVEISVWQFYFKQILAQHGHKLDVPVKTRFESEPDGEWVNDDDIYDMSEAGSEKVIKASEQEIMGVFNLMNDPNVTYSDATKKTFTIVCKKLSSGKWVSKIEKVRAACAIDVETYRKLMKR